MVPDVQRAGAALRARAAQHPLPAAAAGLAAAAPARQAAAARHHARVPIAAESATQLDSHLMLKNLKPALRLAREPRVMAAKGRECAVWNRIEGYTYRLLTWSSRLSRPERV